MTAEVAVMNRMAVALAADSAVTVTRAGTAKIHNSAVKLLMLSKRHPVGVMVYNNASLLDVPWETIIKLFRRKLGNTAFDQLEMYGEQLVAYLNDNTDLFPVEAQERYYLETLRAEYSNIARQAQAELLDRIQYGEARSEEELRNHQIECAENAIQRRVEFWNQQNTVESVDEALCKEFVGKLSGEISNRVLEVFEGWPTDANSTRPLWELANLLILKDHFAPDWFSGVVLAGFGEKEHFPVLQHFQIGGIYGNRLKVRYHPCEQISGTTPSIVTPFAYTEMVNTFLYGIPSENLENLETAIRLIRDMPIVAIDSLKELSPDQRARLKQKIGMASLKQARKFSDSVLRGCAYRHQNIMQAIATLPTKELAQVASTLVSLSSFQQRMSPEPETVGGPVDVAVISKGDGFIWIDRKHYFRRELNQHFFDNYFEDVPEQERDDVKISNDQTADAYGERD